MDNIEKTKIYFDKNVQRLRRTKEKYQVEIVYATASTLNSKLRGKVLDIGSGGNINYSLDNIEKLVSLDISATSLETSKRDGKIESIPGDARSLGLKDNLFDCVAILHTVHHLACDDVSATLKNVEDCFRESHRVLKKTGRIFIIDAVCPGIVQTIENLLFRFTLWALGLLDKPMVYYFSLSDLIAILRKVGFKKIESSYLDTGSSKLCPFTSSIGIPFSLTPLSHIFIEGEK